MSVMIAERPVKTRLAAQAAHLVRADGTLIARGALIVVPGELPDVIMFEGDVFMRHSFGLPVEIYQYARPFRADALFQPVDAP